MKIEVGSWVRFSRWPTWVPTMNDEFQIVFRMCFGNVYRALEITQEGHLVLDVHEDVDHALGGVWNDIRLEPEYVDVVGGPESSG